MNAYRSYRFKTKDPLMHSVAHPKKWVIYIPEEGHWPINYKGDNAKIARRVYLRWAGRNRLPAGARITRI